MIYLILFMIIYSILTAFNHKAMINKISKLWHTLSAVIDGFVIVVFALFLQYNWIYIGRWTDFILIGMMFMLIRDISRTFILGIGTTSWIDRNIKGFWRLVLWMFLAFMTFCYLHWYFTITEYVPAFKNLDKLDTFLELF